MFGSSNTREIGKEGEKLAVEFLKRQGYRILKRNFTTRFGEIDIIARHGDTVCFIEVKFRGQDAFGSPYDALNRRKQFQIAKSALVYLKASRQADSNYRFDLVAIQQNKSEPKPRIELIPDAFPLPENWTI